MNVFNNSYGILILEKEIGESHNIFYNRSDLISDEISKELNSQLSNKTLPSISDTSHLKTVSTTFNTGRAGLLTIRRPNGF